MQHKKYLMPLYALGFVFFVCTFHTFFLVPSSHANSWHPRIYDYALPTRVVAVDKKEQKFYLFEKKSPLTLKLAYPCTTGQVDGDKEVVNDLRTPEGVYFVEYKIAKGLDFREYGGIAYTLNYPNPVDKLRGKTGYGIWIHSKGLDADIVPNNTRGCIAIGRDNIKEVGPMLLPGTAVVVGESFNTNILPTEETGTARHLRLRMEQWTRAWASRSNKFFDFYNAEAYSKSIESFKAFRSNKERLFKLLPWINIFNREVHVLEGPGYWVTWADQFYRAPNLSTEGIRRLYWQRNNDGQFRIVGMEWIPRNVGMQAAFEKGQLVATLQNTATDASYQEEMPTPPPLSMPENADNVISVAQNLQGAEMAPASNTPLQGGVLVKQKNNQQDNKDSNHSKPAKLVLTNEIQTIIQENADKRTKAWLGRDAKAFYAMYDEKKFGKIQGLPEASMQELKQAMGPYFSTAWLDMATSKLQMIVHENTLVTIASHFIYLPGKRIVEGEEHLFWQQDATNEWRVVASMWKAKRLGMEAAYLEKISTTVSEFIEVWRKDWLNADVKAYANHYAANATQGSRSKGAMTSQKKALWEKAAPAEVQLSGLRVQLDAKGVRVDMTQVYRDKNDKGDKGTKTLLLEPTVNGWKIVKEEWVGLNQN